jgi:hypothetical protein
MKVEGVKGTTTHRMGESTLRQTHSNVSRCSTTTWGLRFRQANSAEGVACFSMCFASFHLMGRSSSVEAEEKQDLLLAETETLVVDLLVRLLPSVLGELKSDRL